MDTVRALATTSRRLAMAALTGAFVFGAGLPLDAAAQRIFTCVDAKGRKITADRPIPDCIDREQAELSRSGTVVRKIGPTLTAQELAAQDARDKAQAVEQARLLEDKRRERALVLRYPNVALHNRERNASLAIVDEVIASSNQRTQELFRERKAIASEMEFYVKDPSKAPFALKNRSDANDANLKSQQAFVANQNIEKQRINQRFDEELELLKPLWAKRGPAVP